MADENEDAAAEEAQYVQYEVPDLPNGEILLWRSDDKADISGGRWAKVKGGFVITKDAREIAEMDAHDPGATDTPKQPYAYRVPLRTDRPTKAKKKTAPPPNTEG